MRLTGKVVGLGVLGLLALIVLIVLGTMWGLGVGWFKGEANLRSFGHVQDTYREAYDDANALDATAQSICVARQGLLQAKQSNDDNAAQQRETQLLAYETNYNRVRGEYQAYMTDHFRGKLYHPADLPLPYPTLNEKIKTTC